MDQVNERVKMAMQKFGLTQKDFAEKIGVSQPIITYIVNGRNKVSLEVVQKIATVFEQINLDWLVLGKGDMLNSAKPNTAIDESKIDSTITELELILKLSNTNLKTCINSLKSLTIGK